MRSSGKRIEISSSAIAKEFSLIEADPVNACLFSSLYILTLLGNFLMHLNETILPPKNQVILDSQESTV